MDNVFVYIMNLPAYIDIALKTSFCLIKVKLENLSTFKMGKFILALNRIIMVLGFSHCASSCSAVMLGPSSRLPESARKHWRQMWHLAELTCKS